MGNFFITASIETIAEAQTLADKTGLSRKNVMDFINTYVMHSKYYGCAICLSAFLVCCLPQFYKDTVAGYAPTSLQLMRVALVFLFGED